MDTTNQIELEFKTEGLTMVPSLKKEGLVGPTSGRFTSFHQAICWHFPALSSDEVHPWCERNFKDETLPPFFWGHVGMWSKPLYP